MKTETIQIFSIAIEIKEHRNIPQTTLAQTQWKIPSVTTHRTAVWNKSSCDQQTRKYSYHSFYFIFKLRDENVGWRNLVYNNPYDFEDGVTASQ
jgi:hypothetical protein